MIVKMKRNLLKLNQNPEGILRGNNLNLLHVGEGDIKFVSPRKIIYLEGIAPVKFDFFSVYYTKRVTIIKKTSSSHSCLALNK